jgi:DNA-directed RNA polymerase subunit RPC12/RpoP
VLDDAVNKAIIWQNEEVPVGQVKCMEFSGTRGSLGGQQVSAGTLVVTNQRILFVCKSGLFSQSYGINYALNLEDIVSASLGKRGLINKLGLINNLIILDKANQREEFTDFNVATRKVHLLIPVITSAVRQRKSQIQTEKEKERVQIVLDFSSLKEVMSKGGLIVTNYKCPNCSGMLEIPEAGKILTCKYCGALIKPIDIFDKIKALLQ